MPLERARINVCFGLRQDARYLLGIVKNVTAKTIVKNVTAKTIVKNVTAKTIVKNVTAKTEGELLAQALWDERMRARDFFLATLACAAPRKR